MAQDRKIRVDQLLVDRGLSPSRARAQALVLAGLVIVGEQRVDKPGTRVSQDAPVRVKGPDHPYVSRGGVKLEGALEAFGIAVTDLVALDAGASTGGFTDCLLQRGARRVYAVDVGRAQLHQKLRADPRVVVIERLNIRGLQPEHLGEPCDLAVADLAFISLRLVLAPIAACVRPGGLVIPLVKPQFELSQAEVGRGGIVRDEVLREKAIESVAAFARDLGLVERGRVASSLPGADGNQEYLLCLEKP